MSMEGYSYHIFSPYRVCPLGAHVDHQHGLVTGFAFDKGVDLWFSPTEDGIVSLKSLTFDHKVNCRAAAIGHPELSRFNSPVRRQKFRKKSQTSCGISRRRCKMHRIKRN